MGDVGNGGSCMGMGEGIYRKYLHFFSVLLDRLPNILGALGSGFILCLFFKVFCLLKVVFVQSLSRVSLWPHGLQHPRLLCPSLSPRFAQTHVHRASDAIQPTHLLSPLPLLSIFPSIRVFSKQSALRIMWPKHGASASVLPMSIQNWFSLGLTGLILLSKGLSRLFSSTTILRCSAFLMA